VSAATLVTVVPERSAPRRTHWYRQPALISGLVIILVIIGLAIAAPLITSYNPIAQNLNATLQGPSAHHLLGTDQFGRDVFTRLLYGARVDLKIGFIAVLFPFVLGTILGSLAGYFGGWIELIVMRLVDIVVAFPFYVLLIALVFVLGPGESSIYIAITIVGWVSYARLVRAEILVAKRQEYVLAAERHQPGDHLRDVRHRPGHPGHRDARLLRPRHPAADGGMGFHDQRGAELPDHALGARDDPRPGRGGRGPRPVPDR
jgi:peptide/nickel transport system permease protein